MKILKNIAQICGVIAVTCLLLYGAVLLTRPKTVDYEVATIEAFHRMPDFSLDVIAYGSSHMWQGIKPSQLKEQYGIEAYNYADAWQRLNTTTLFVEDSLITQKPKVAIIDTHKFNQVLRDVDMDGEIYYTRFLKETPSRKRFLQDCFGGELERYLSYIFPFISFHQNWAEVDEKTFTQTPEDLVPEFIELRGFRQKIRPTAIDLHYDPNVEQSELSEESIKELDYIMSLFGNSGTKVIFITVPYEGDDTFHDSIAEYAALHDIPYLNLFEYIDEIGLDGETDFVDEGHLNDSGATKVTEFMGEYLKENYPEVL